MEQNIDRGAANARVKKHQTHSRARARSDWFGTGTRAFAHRILVLDDPWMLSYFRKRKTLLRVILQELKKEKEK